MLIGGLTLGWLASNGRAVAQLGNADVELDVGRVDVAQVLKRHAVRAAVAGQDEPRPAHADRHVGRDGLLDLEPIGCDRHLAVGVDDLDVVQAMRRARQVELGDDLVLLTKSVISGWYSAKPGITSLTIALGWNWAPLIVVVTYLLSPALIDLHVGDRQREQLGQHAHGRVGGRLGMAANQDVVDAGNRRRHDRQTGWAPGPPDRHRRRPSRSVRSLA